MQAGRLAARAVIGGLFVGHGAQKLFGAFGGPGIEGFSAMTGKLGMYPATPNAYAGALSEFGGGIGVLTGTASPLAAAALVGTMITAIRKVHGTNGPWVTKGGYEYNLVLIAALLALVESGPGGGSVDEALGLDLSGTRWALAALALGAAASTAAIEIGRRNAPAEIPGEDAPDGA